MNNRDNTFKKIIESLNELAISNAFAIGGLQQKRAAGKKRAFAKIFTGHSIFDRYAFHTGGRSEIQFNIGVEEHGDGEKWFRYGLAFSLEGSINLQDPVGTFAPRIQAFNKYVRENSATLNDILLWKHGDIYEAPRLLHEIPSDWIARNTFIFLGKYTTKPIKNLEESDILSVLEYLDRLLPIYDYVESNRGQFEQKREKRVSKICWNCNGWQKPSGQEGKSADMSSHEHHYRYGHEEWLFDFDKTIGGYHYAYLQPIGKHRDKYTGEVFDIDLYSVNSTEHHSYWVAELKSAEVLDKETEKKVIEIYRKRGWLGEMLGDLNAVGADVENFKEWVERDGIFNIRFRPQDVYWFGTEPVPFADDEKISHTRYTLLYRDHVRRKPDHTVGIISGIDRKDINDLKTQRRSQRIVECSQLHNEIQNSLLGYLREAFPDEEIKLEGGTGYGTNIDLYRKAQSGVTYFYEVKTYPSAKACIREALGQLIEYAFYPDRKMANFLVIVSQAPLGDDERKYLSHLQSQLPIPVGYIQFDCENVCIVEEL
jgi:hypothetical protein